MSRRVAPGAAVRQLAFAFSPTEATRVLRCLLCDDPREPTPSGTPLCGACYERLLTARRP